MACPFSFLFYSENKNGFKFSKKKIMIQIFLNKWDTPPCTPEKIIYGLQYESK